MSWNLTKAHYIKKDNSVAETRVKSNMTYDNAIHLLNKLKGQAVYIWEDNCSELYDMTYGCIETEAYAEEYSKIIG